MTSRVTGLPRRLMAGGLWAFLGKSGAAFLGLLVSMLLARVSSAHALGLYFQAVALVGIATSVSQLGLAQSALRQIATVQGSSPPRARSLARASVWLALGAGVAGALVLAAIRVLAGAWLPPALTGGGLALSGWLFGMVVTGILAETFRGAARLGAAALHSGLLTSAIVFLLLALSWWQGLALDYPAIAQLFWVATGISAGAALWHAAASFGIGRVAREDMGALLGGALSIGVTNLLLLLFSQVDVLILGAFRGSEEVALYGAAARLVALLALMLGVVNLAVAPFVAELSAQQRHGELERMLRRTATLAGVPAILLLLLFAWQGDRLLGLVFGPAYGVAARVLVILALGQVVNVLAGSCGTVLMMTGHGALLLRLTLACGGATLAAVALLAWLWGGIGVAVAIAAGLALQNVIMVVAARRTAGVRTYCYLPGLSRSG